jgi:hypothetical protein
LFVLGRTSRTSKGSTLRCYGSLGMILASRTPENVRDHGEIDSVTVESSESAIFAENP